MRELPLASATGKLASAGPSSVLGWASAAGTTRASNELRPHRGREFFDDLDNFPSVDEE